MRFAEKIKSLKNDILGKKYSLSIAFVNEKKSQEINKKYRGKNKPTNVLSFALSPKEGEIILCRSVIQKEAKEKKFGKNFRELVLFLVIHGMLHLKGLLHSSTMEKAENFYFEKYNKQYDKKHNSRHRLGVVGDESRRRRVREGRKKS